MKISIHSSIFNKAYLPHLTDYNSKTEIYYGGAGSGKSVFIAQKILYKLLRSKRKALCIRKTLVSQKESCWRLICDILSQWKIYDMCTVRISDYLIELPNGSIILFKGIDDPERIKSIVGITDIWVEEATELEEEDYDQLKLRLRADVPNLQMFLSFNPVSKANWLYKRYFQEGAEVPTDTKIIKTTYKDNKFLPTDYIESLENMLKTNPTYYRIYALGEFCSLDKLVYNNWRVEPFDHSKIQGDMLIGLDYGFVNDISALVASVCDEAEKKIYIFRTWGDLNKTNDELARIITSLGFSKSVIIADSAEPKSIEELRRLGIMRIRPSVKGQDSIVHGIQRLQQYQIIVHPSCEGIITEFENYSWTKDKNTNEYTNKPIDAFNHYLDALRYSMQCKDVSHLKTMDKAVLGL